MVIFTYYTVTADWTLTMPRDDALCGQTGRNITREFWLKPGKKSDGAKMAKIRGGMLR